MPVVTESLAQLLAKQVNDKGLVVWYDPEQAYCAAVAELAIPNTTLALYDGSFLKLRKQIDHLLNDGQPPRLVVYVPMERTETHNALIELQILDKMPSTQTPNYFKVGVNNPDFETQRPFIIDGAVSSGTSSSTPNVVGPSSLDRTVDNAPTFNVNTAGAPYYIFEITTDSSLFANRGGRNTSNFYGSYDDSGVVPSRLTSATFNLPDPAWQTLKSADTLYYRVGTTTSLTGWDNYTDSTTDDQGANAPSIAVTGAKAGMESAPAAVPTVAA
jgi:hypothetical protein